MDFGGFEELGFPVGMLLLAVMTIGLGYVVLLLFRGPAKGAADGAGANASRAGPADAAGGSGAGTSQGKGKGKAKGKWGLGALTGFITPKYEDHPWFAATLKGHSGTVYGMEWSPNGKYLASWADDRTVMIWLAKSYLYSKDRLLSVKVNIPYDDVRYFCWSPDSTAFIVARKNENILEVFKVAKKDSGVGLTVESFKQFKKVHQSPICGIGIAPHGKFIFSADTFGKIVLWDLKGEILIRTDAIFSDVVVAKLSRCGRYIITAGKHSEAEIQEVTYTNMNEVKGIGMFAKLKGHESTITGLDGSPDFGRLATITEKGNWKLFDTTGTRITVTAQGSVRGTVDNIKLEVSPTITMSPDMGVLVSGYDNSISTIGIVVGAGTVEANIPASFCIPIPSPQNITFTADGKFLMVASGKTIVAFHNVAGSHEALRHYSRHIGCFAKNTCAARMEHDAKAVLQNLVDLGLEKTIDGDPELVKFCKSLK